MKIKCTCGHLIVDNTDYLSHKGYVISDVEYYDMLDAIEHVVMNPSDTKKEREKAMVQLQDRIFGWVNIAWECINCGRVYFNDREKDAKGIFDLVEFKPEAGTYAGVLKGARVRTAHEVYMDESLRYGSFYELSIETSGNDSDLASRKAVETLFGLDFIEGPSSDLLDNFPLAGLLNLREFHGPFILGCLHVYGRQLPFKLILRHDLWEGGSNWIEITIYTNMLEHVLGEQYKTWTEDPVYHDGLDFLLKRTFKAIHQAHPVRLGLLGFETSDSDLNYDWLMENDLTPETVKYTRVMVGNDVFGKLSKQNQEQVILVE